MRVEDIESLAIAIGKALQQARSVSDSEHFDHHQWITAKIKREEVRRLFYERLTTHLINWGMVGVLSGTLYALYLGVRILLKLPL